MPEVAECWSISKKLNEKIKTNDSIEKVWISKEFIKHIGKKEILDIEKSHIHEIKAFGKSIWFYLNKANEKMILVSQLGMTGGWFWGDVKEVRNHAHLGIKLKNQALFYIDPRMFGSIHLWKGQDFETISHEIIKSKKWGIDPMISSIDSIYNQLLKIKGSRSIKIKLLEQNLIFGIGNYLASEVLFRAKINPKRTTDSILKKEYEQLAISIHDTVREAFSSGGFSFAGGYHLPDGSFGHFSKKVKIYNKTKCPNCDNSVIKEFIANRATYFCNKCQK